MPPVIIAVVVFAAAYALPMVTLSMAISMAMMAYSLSASLMAKKPKPPSSSGVDFSARERTITVRQPAAARRIVYGQVRIGGIYAFIHSRDNNAYLHMIIALTGHECEELGDIYFDEELVSIAGDGAVGGKYDTWAWVDKHLGAADQTANTRFTGSIPDKWTNNHRLRGVGYLAVMLSWSPDIYFNGVPNITCVTKGRLVYDPRDPYQDPADATTWGWSDNPALCLADYLTNETFGLGAVYVDEIDEDELIASANICDELVPLNNGASPIEYEKRYTCNGSFTTDQKPKEILGELMTCMSGRVDFIGGKWLIKAGAYRTPTITLTEDDLRDGYTVQSRITRRDNCNAVKGIFVSPENKWQPTDFPAVISDTSAAEDNDERVFRDINLPYTTSSGMAQRLAKIELLRARQQITATLPCKLSGYQVQSGDTVSVTLSDMGWNAKVFEVQETALVTGDDGYLGVDLKLRETAANVFDWAASEEQAFDAAPDTTLPNAFTVGSPANLMLASGTEHLLALPEGSVLARIFVSWDAVGDAFVDDYEVQHRKSLDADWLPSLFVRAATSCYIAPVEDGTLYDVRVRAINALGVRSASWAQSLNHLVIGKSEPPDAPQSFTVERLADGTRRYAWTLDPLPADVRSGGGFNIYYKSGGGTPALSTMTALNALGLLRNSPFESNELAAGTYAFAVTAVDSSGNESDPTYAVVTIGDPRLRNVLDQRLEHVLGWPGTKTNCYVDTDGVLRAGPTTGSPQGDWASLAGRAWSTLSGQTWESVTARAASIVYRTPIIDLEANVSFTPLLSFVGNGTDTYRMATGASGQSPTVDAFGPVGPVTAKRYVQFEMTVTGSVPRAQQLTILLDGETQVDEFEDVNVATETATWFQLLGTGNFLIGTKSNNMSSITRASITALQNVAGAWTWELVSKSRTVGGSPGVPAAEFKVRNAAGALANPPLIDVELKGPKVN